jgi:hypothetical protein
MSEMKPIYFAPENWLGKPCPVCRGAAEGRKLLYDREPSAPPEPDNRRPIGEVFSHPTKTDCVRPPELAAALSTKK